MSLFRPARGCSRDGSGRAAASRNEETSCAEAGSKAVGWKVVLGDDEDDDEDEDVSREEEELDDEDDEDDDDF